MKSTIILVVIGFVTFAFGDDAILGSRGGNVYPIHSSSIKMIKEHIYVDMFRDSCVTYCKFWFYNTGKKDTIMMGFQNFIENPGTGSKPLRNFKTKVNKKETIVTLNTEKQAEINSKYKDTYINEWFTWTVEIVSSETLFVENSFSGDWGNTVWKTITYEYILGTGRTWFGPILKGRIVLDHSRLGSKHFIQSIRNDKQINVEQYNDSIVFTFSNYTPKEHESIVFELLHYWKYAPPPENHDYFPVRDDLIKRKLTKNDFRLMRNEIFARHGYTFKAKDLNEYFKHFKWYKPKKTFSINSMTKGEQAFIQLLKALEKGEI